VPTLERAGSIVGMIAEPAHISAPSQNPAPQQRARAVRAVAGCARDADDLAELLDMLGLDPADARPQPQHMAPEVPEMPAPRGRGIPIAELTAMLAAAGFTQEKCRTA